MPDDALIWIAAELETEQACVDLAERLRWPRDVRCVHCGSPRVFRFVTREKTRKVKRADGHLDTVPVPARHLFQCVDRGHQFTVSTGTVLHDTHLPLTKWFFAVALMVNSRGNVTASQIQRDLGVSYQTAWYLHHRIREALE